MSGKASFPQSLGLIIFPSLSTQTSDHLEFNLLKYLPKLFMLYQIKLLVVIFSVLLVYRNTIYIWLLIVQPR